jgi:hypothetical protein
MNDYMKIVSQNKRIKSYKMLLLLRYFNFMFRRDLVLIKFEHSLEERNERAKKT